MQTTLTTFVRAVALAGLCTLVVACGGATSSVPATAVPPPTTATIAPPTLAPAPTAVAVVTPNTPAPTIAAQAPTAQSVATSLPTAAAAQPTTAAAAKPTAASQATAATVAQPTSTSAPTAGTAAQATSQTSASGTASAASAADAVQLVLDSSSSTASYHATETLVGNNLPTPAIGTTPGVSGNVVIAADGSIDPDQSMITVDLSMLKSDEGRRDNFIKTNTLQTSKFPTATFVAREAQGLSMPLPTSGQAVFELLGDLTVHGVTNPATWQVTAQFADSSVSGNATTTVKLTDFGMSPPKAGPVLSIVDDIVLVLDFTANHGN